MLGCAIAGAGSDGLVLGWKADGIGCTRKSIMVDGWAGGREEKQRKGLDRLRVDM